MTATRFTVTPIDEDAAARHDRATCRFCDPNSEDYITVEPPSPDAYLENMRHRLRMWFE